MSSPDFWADVRRRLDRGPARVMCFTKGGLPERLDEMSRGEAPSDFFYGVLGMLQDGEDVRMVSTSDPYEGLGGVLHRLKERGIARLFGISDRRHFLDSICDDWRDAEIVVSFVDHFSLSMGHYFRDRRPRPKTVGLFHGLSDLAGRMTGAGRLVAERYLARGVEGLDLVGFFGPADRAEAMRRFGLPEERTAMLRFGVDHGFWCPGDTAGGAGILAVGSDPSRDFDTLVNADVPGPVRILTRLPVEVPPGRDGVSIIRGSFAAMSMTDLGLRDAYRAADIVVVPLKDVFQPTGYSVTLQAMACARPVVLTDIKGLWTPELLVDGENCLLVPPYDRAAMAEAVRRLVADPSLAHRIGAAARATVEEHFSIARMNDSLRTLIGKLDDGRRAA